MITPSQWKQIEKQTNKLYNQLEIEIIQEIAERIANVGYANTVVLNDMLIAQEMGLMYQEVISLVAKYNNTSASQIEEIFETAGVKSLEYDDKIYRLAGLNPNSLKQSASMWQLLESTALKTHNNLSNLVMTTASSAQTQFYNAMNQSYMEVSTGVKSYSQSIMDTIKDISKQGTYITYPSGKRMSIESAVRMNIITSVNQTCGKLQEMRADELEWDLMEITAHSGARPEHAVWQGGIVSRSGQSGYLSLTDIGYGEVTGFKGVNCRHDWRPYYEGSSLTYSKDELQEMKNAKVKYNGQVMSKYNAEQLQRKIERQIRQDKKEIAGLEGILRSNTTDNKLIEETKSQFAKKTLIYKTHQTELSNLLEQTSLKIDNTRLYVGSLDKTITAQVSNISKLASAYNNSNIIGMNVNNTKITVIGEHVISQTYARNLSVSDIENTLKNPIKYGKIRTDKSQQICGETCTVVINTETGKLITTYAKKTKKE